jgi:hypothetical protein
MIGTLWPADSKFLEKLLDRLSGMLKADHIDALDIAYCGLIALILVWVCAIAAHAIRVVRGRAYRAKETAPSPNLRF